MEEWRKWQRRHTSTYFIDSWKVVWPVAAAVTNTTNTLEARYPWRPLATSLLRYFLLPSSTSHPSPKRRCLVFLNHPSRQFCSLSFFFSFSYCLHISFSLSLSICPSSFLNHQSHQHSTSSMLSLSLSLIVSISPSLFPHLSLCVQLFFVLYPFHQGDSTFFCGWLFSFPSPPLYFLCLVLPLHCLFLLSSPFICRSLASPHPHAATHLHYTFIRSLLHVSISFYLSFYASFPLCKFLFPLIVH